MTTLKCSLSIITHKKLSLSEIEKTTKKHSLISRKTISECLIFSER